jgi:flavin-dependent dehydrogenase
MNRFNDVKQYDVAVVGGGPAGLVVALTARSRGLHVAVMEASHPPLDKACGEGLMVDSLLALGKLGIHLNTEDGIQFKGIRFLQRGRTVEAEFPEGLALGVRRTTLHGRLVERAESAGVEIHWDSPVRGLDPNTVICGNTRFQARWIVGADGLNSHVRRLIGLNGFVWSRERLGVRQHFAVKPWSNYVDVHWGEHCQCYITPIGPEEVSVAFLTRDKQARFDDLLRLFPEVADRVRNAAPTSRMRGALTAMRKVRRIYKGNVALAGDAAGTVDAITGQGIGLAFQQAAALAEALAIGNLRQYARRHAAIMRRPTLMAIGLMLMGEHARVRELAMAVLAKKPSSFSKLLALHVGFGRGF